MYVLLKTIVTTKAKKQIISLFVSVFSILALLLFFTFLPAAHAPHATAFKAHRPPNFALTSLSVVCLSRLPSQIPVFCLPRASSSSTPRTRARNGRATRPIRRARPQQPWGCHGGAGAFASSSWRPCSSSLPRRCSSSPRHARGAGLLRSSRPPPPTRSSPACATLAARTRRRPPGATHCTSGAPSGPRSTATTSTTTTGPCRCRCRLQAATAAAGRRSTCATASPSGSSRRGRTRCTTEAHARRAPRRRRTTTTTWRRRSVHRFLDAELLARCKHRSSASLVPAFRPARAAPPERTYNGGPIDAWAVPRA